MELRKLAETVSKKPALCYKFAGGNEMERCSKHQGKDKEDFMRRVGEGAEQNTLEEEIVSIRKNKKEKELRGKRDYIKILYPFKFSTE